MRRAMIGKKQNPFRRSVLAIGLLASPLLFGAEAYTLRTSFSKNPIYEGESTTVKFVLYGTAGFVEAEVAKFPEFRGFWTQNHVLRQGPLPLIPELGSGGLNQALIGSYSLTPMVGRRDSTIIPMKMILRSSDFFHPDAAGEGMEIWSEKDQLQILPLPPVPGPLHSKFFGAVGRISLFTDNQTLYFHPDEPVSMRVAVRGLANFPDITDIAIAWPERIRVVSRRTFLDPTVPPTKIFEYTVVIRGDSPITLPGAELAYFNPETKQYDLAQGMEVRFEPQPAPPLEAIQPEFFGVPDEKEQVSFQWQTSPLFWFLQILIGLALGYIVSRRALQAWNRRPATLQKKLLKAREVQISEQLKSNNSLQVLRTLENLLLKVRGGSQTNQSKALKYMEKNWSKEGTETARWVFDSWNETFAPPEARPEQVSTGRLQKAWTTLWKALRRQK